MNALYTKANAEQENNECKEKVEKRAAVGHVCHVSAPQRNCSPAHLDFLSTKKSSVCVTTIAIHHRLTSQLLANLISHPLPCIQAPSPVLDVSP